MKKKNRDETLRETSRRDKTDGVTDGRKQERKNEGMLEAGHLLLLRRHYPKE